MGTAPLSVAMPLNPYREAASESPAGDAEGSAPPPGPPHVCVFYIGLAAGMRSFNRSDAKLPSLIFI